MSPVLTLAVLKLVLKLDIGPEYDTNASRAETVAGVQNPDHPIGSALLRTTTQLGLRWKRGDNLLSVSGVLGGKVFFNSKVFDQDVLAGSLVLDDKYSFGHVHLGIAADYYEAGQLGYTPACANNNPPCDRERDFRTGGVQPNLQFSGAGGSLLLGGGYRTFQWKADSIYDYDAAVANAAFATHFASGAEQQHEWDLTLGYHLERRFYNSLNEVPASSCTTLPCIEPGTEDRRDWFHEASISGTYLGPLLVHLDYAVQVIRSNSFNQSLVRQVLTLKLAARLFWSVYGTLKAQLMVTGYAEPLLIDTRISSMVSAPATAISIEDENRNAIIADLERAFGKTGLAMNLRYSFFTNELGNSPVSYLRHTVYLGLTYRYEYLRR